MDTTITYRARVTIHGELREIAGGETIEANNIITGVQTIGDSYEAIAGTAPNVAVMLYNTGTVDVSVRVLIQPANTFTYLFFTLIPGGLMCIPKSFISDQGDASFAISVFARTSSGTAEVEYCHIY